MKAYRETINRGGSRTVGPKPKAPPAPDATAAAGGAEASSDPAVTESTKRRGGKAADAGGEG